MHMTTTPAENNRHHAVSAVLFLCLFAGQAGAIALSPLLAEVARDLDVSIATAGQLRTVAGLAAGVTALALGRLGTRVALGRQLLYGAILLALGSLASAAAPGIGLLAAAQVPSVPASRSSRPQARSPLPSGCRPSSGLPHSPGR